MKLRSFINFYAKTLKLNEFSNKFSLQNFAVLKGIKYVLSKTAYRTRWGRWLMWKKWSGTTHSSYQQWHTQSKLQAGCRRDKNRPRLHLSLRGHVTGGLSCAPLDQHCAKFKCAKSTALPRPELCEAERVQHAARAIKCWDSICGGRRRRPAN